MKVVDYKEYSDDKQKFMEAHDYDFRVETSPMDQYGKYMKTYIFEDGAQMFEVMMPVYEKVTMEIHKVEVSVDVKFFRTEYWTTDDSCSRYYYEKF